MLVTLNDMKNFLGIALGDTTYDAFLTLQLQLISDAVEGYCKRKFAQASYTQEFYLGDVSYSNQLPLYHFPLIGAPVVNEVDEAGNNSLVVDYRYHANSGVLTKSHGRFFNTANKVEVQYTAGYATIPALIQNVVYSLVQERYNKKVNGIDLNFGSDVQRISIPGTISIDFDYSLNNNERKSPFGHILGSHLNILDAFRADRAVVGSVRAYV
jgi:hypothetical protein